MDWSSLKSSLKHALDSLNNYLLEGRDADDNQKVSQAIMTGIFAGIEAGTERTNEQSTPLNSLHIPYMEPNT